MWTGLDLFVWISSLHLTLADWAIFRCGVLGYGGVATHQLLVVFSIALLWVSLTRTAAQSEALLVIRLLLATVAGKQLFFCPARTGRTERWPDLLISEADLWGGTLLLCISHPVFLHLQWWVADSSSSPPPARRRAAVQTSRDLQGPWASHSFSPQSIVITVAVVRLSFMIIDALIVF